MLLVICILTAVIASTTDETVVTSGNQGVFKFILLGCYFSACMYKHYSL